MKVKVKSEEQLSEQLIYFVENYCKSIPDEGFLSKDSLIKNELDRINFISNKIIDVEKVPHTDGGHHYKFLWFTDNDKNYYGNIDEENIESIVEV